MITVGIASMKERRESLNQTLESLIPQVDHIHVYLNDYQREDTIKKVSFYSGDDLGDVGKFYGLLFDSDIYLSCDDDLTYSPDYVNTICRGLNRYGGFVSFHGRKFNGIIRGYYRNGRVYHCLSDSGNHRVHIPGSGVMAFKPNGFSMKHCKYPNMSDIFVGLYAQDNKLPVTVLEHKKGIVTHNDIDLDKTIHSRYYKHDQLQTKLVSKRKWKIY